MDFGRAGYLRTITFAFAFALALTTMVVSGCDKEKKRYPIATDATLVLVRESKMATLIPSGGDSLEASGVAFDASAAVLRIVSDNTTSVATVDVDLAKGTLSAGDVMNSQYEAITFGSKKAFVSIEGSPATIAELDDDGNPVATCPAPDLVFGDPNKAIEGLAWIGDSSGEDRLLALSELDGLVTVLARGNDEWTPIATMAHPAATAAFADYSDIALRARADGSNSYDVAITSQQSSVVWIGMLTTNPYQLVGPGKLYGFPLATDGSVRYCTVEGVSFIDDRTLAFVSDKAHHDEPSCASEEESVHIFSVP